MTARRYDRTQGDPKVTLTKDGADLTFRGGQPVMDSGLENAVMISLFSGAAWFGNVYMPKAGQVKSRFYPLTLKTITASRLAELENAAKADLAPLVSAGAIADPSVRVTNPDGNRLDVTITISPPGSDAVTILLSRYGANWAVQTSNPANERV